MGWAGIDVGSWENTEDTALILAVTDDEEVKNFSGVCIDEEFGSIVDIK